MQRTLSATSSHRHGAQVARATQPAVLAACAGEVGDQVTQSRVTSVLGAELAAAGRRISALQQARDASTPKTDLYRKHTEDLRAVERTHRVLRAAVAALPSSPQAVAGVPDAQGLTLADARQLLEAAGQPVPSDWYARGISIDGS